MRQHQLSCRLFPCRVIPQRCAPIVCPPICAAPVFSMIPLLCPSIQSNLDWCVCLAIRRAPLFRDILSSVSFRGVSLSFVFCSWLCPCRGCLCRPFHSFHIMNRSLEFVDLDDKSFGADWVFLRAYSSFSNFLHKSRPYCRGSSFDQQVNAKSACLQTLDDNSDVDQIRQCFSNASMRSPLNDIASKFTSFETVVIVEIGSYLQRNLNPKMFEKMLWRITLEGGVESLVGCVCTDGGCSCM